MKRLKMSYILAFYAGLSAFLGGISLIGKDFYLAAFFLGMTVFASLVTVICAIKENKQQ